MGTRHSLISWGIKGTQHLALWMLCFSLFLSGSKASFPFSKTKINKITLQTPTTEKMPFWFFQVFLWNLVYKMLFIDLFYMLPANLPCWVFAGASALPQHIPGNVSIPLQRCHFSKDSQLKRYILSYIKCQCWACSSFSNSPCLHTAWTLQTRIHSPAHGLQYFLRTGGRNWEQGFVEVSVCGMKFGVRRAVVCC